MDRTQKESWGWGNGSRIEEAEVVLGVMERTGPRLGKQHGIEW